MILEWDISLIQPYNNTIDIHNKIGRHNEIKIAMIKHQYNSPHVKVWENV